MFSGTAGNIANYLKFLEVDSMYLPVPVNFIFVGFEGKGNQGMYYSFTLPSTKRYLIVPSQLKMTVLFVIFLHGKYWLYYSLLLRCGFCSEFKLQPEELERWFTKIDHILEHTRIPQVGEVLTPFYKTSIDREQRHHLPLISHINYKYFLFPFPETTIQSAWV